MWIYLSANFLKIDTIEKRWSNSKNKSFPCWCKYYILVILQPKKTVTLSSDPNVVQSREEEDDLAKGIQRTQDQQVWIKPLLLTQNISYWDWPQVIITIK